VATLSGDEEGFFAAVAANYLHGAIAADLSLHTRTNSSTLNRHDEQQQQQPAIVGALDMGGSSTQMVFLPESARSRQSSCGSNSTGDDDETLAAEDHYQACPVNNNENINKLQTDGFFINSYLSYGVDQFRQRLWKRWIEQHQQQIRAESSSVEDVCDSKIILNPCVFAGYRIEFEGYMLIGTGQAKQFVQQVRAVLKDDSTAIAAASTNSSSTTCSSSYYSVGGVQHPPVRGKFYAMSNYFYTLDSLRQFVVELHKDDDKQKDASASAKAAAALQRSWPTPTLHELSQALPLFCNQAWHLILEQQEAVPHAYTQPHMLPRRCLEAVYMVTLLKDGFGFNEHARDITFALHVKDSEVEWTLGMALMLKNSQPQQQQTTTAPTQQQRQPASLLPVKVETMDEEDEEDEEDEDEPVLEPQQDEHRNSTKTRRSDMFSSGTRTILRHVVQFIETASTLDYMHTM
jgi:hypothetical protein